MSEMFASFVAETTTVTGTGDATVASVSLSQTFNTAFGTGTGNRFRYVIRHRTSAEWESGEGYLSASTTLVRERPIYTSNSNALVSFSAGTKDVYCAPIFTDIGGYRTHNVMHYGAKGNADYASGGGNDDTAAIQAAYDAAAASGGYAEVYYPGGRTYRITATINVPQGVKTIGQGSRDASGSSNPSIIVWDGNNSTGIFLVSVSTSNIPGTAFENLTLRSGSGITNKPTWGVRFQRSGGGAAKFDTGTYFREVWIQGMNGNAVDVLGLGSTNFYWQGGRVDACDYGFYVDLSSNGAEFIGQILNTTFAEPRMGVMFLDAEDVTGYAGSIVSVFGVHTELDAGALANETYSSGTNPYDKRGMFRFGCAANAALELMQHRFTFVNLTHAWPSTCKAHCMFQLTKSGGTDVNAANNVMIQGLQLDDAAGSESGSGDAGTTGEARPVGGAIPTSQRYPHIAQRQIGAFNWGKGPLTSTEIVQHYTYARSGWDIRRGLRILPETVADLDTGVQNGGLAYVTDALVGTIGNTVASGGSTKVLVLYNGSAWKIIAAV